MTNQSSRLSQEDRRSNVRVGLTCLFLAFAAFFTFGLFYLTLNSQITESLLNEDTVYSGEPAGSWDPAPDKTEKFKGQDIQVQVIDDKLYMQIKSVDKDLSPEIESLRILDDGSYLVYVKLVKGSDSTAVYRLLIDENFTEGSPVVKQSARGITVVAEEV